MKNDKIILVRHADFGYDKIVPVERYNFGLREIIASMERLVPALDVHEPVTIVHGPATRTDLTARNIGLMLLKKGFSGGEISVDPQLDEVRDFSWEIFSKLMNGGIYTYEGTTFMIEKKMTNVYDLGYPEYFIADAMHKIPAQEKAGWPDAFRKRVEKIESFANVKIRLANVLENLPRETQTILVTHDGLLLELVTSFTGQCRGLQPAGFIQLENRGAKLSIARIYDSNSDITKGNSGTEDIIKILRNGSKTTR